MAMFSVIKIVVIICLQIQCVSTEIAWQNYSSWSSCSHVNASSNGSDRYTGMRMRFMQDCVDTASGNALYNCTNQPYEVENCTVYCPEGCTSAWSSWSICHVNQTSKCGHGYRTRRKLCQDSHFPCESNLPYMVSECHMICKGACMSYGSHVVEMQKPTGENFYFGKVGFDNEVYVIALIVGDNDQLTNKHNISIKYSTSLNQNEWKTVFENKVIYTWPTRTYNWTEPFAAKELLFYVYEDLSVGNLEIRFCNLPVFAEWSTWSDCFGKECNSTGQKTKKRSCLEENVKKKLNPDFCYGRPTKRSLCHYNCAVAEYSSWSEWNLNTSNDSFLSSRTRQCTLKGDPVDEEKCHGHTNETVNISWIWGNCSVTCGEGTRKGKSNCTAVFPKNESLCNHFPTTENMTKCQLAQCPVYEVRNKTTQYCEDWCKGYEKVFFYCFELVKQVEVDWSLCNSTLDREISGKCENGSRCIIEGVFSEWSNWMGDISQEIYFLTRNRTCYFQKELIDAERCNSHDNETVLMSWIWGNCSVTCGEGIRKGKSNCTAVFPKNKTLCNHFPTTENVTKCQLAQCPAGFTVWSSWAEYVSGQNIVYTRNRSCVNEWENTEDCEGHSNETVNISWIWDNCSVTCGEGIRKGKSNCTAVFPKNETLCNHFPTTENMTKCQLAQCPVYEVRNKTTQYCEEWCKGYEKIYFYCFELVQQVEVDWSLCNSTLNREISRECENGSHCIEGEWSNWGECDKPCGNGSQSRKWQCPFGVDDCAKKSLVEERICTLIKCCPVHGGFSAWSEWNSCTELCGAAGSRSRTRQCSSPAPQFGGKPCYGETTITEECNRIYCPVDGVWSAWGDWQPCSRPCSGGKRERKRVCNNPKPSFGGKSCPGNSTESIACNQHSCEKASVRFEAIMKDENYHRSYSDPFDDTAKNSFKDKLMEKLKQSGHDVFDIIIHAIRPSPPP